MKAIVALILSAVITFAEPFGETLGLAVKFSQGEPWSARGNLLELKVKWVRDHQDWKEVERSPGVYEFSQSLKDRLAFYRDHGIGVVFGLWYGNPVAYPSDPFNVEAYGNYAREVAKRLKALGIRFVLECWNEPHNFEIRPRLGGDWVGHPPSPWLDRYVAMVHSAVQKVKAFDPNIKLLTCDDMWAIHYWFLDKGLPSALDGFAFHPYAQPAPEIAAIDYWTDWASPYGTPRENILHMVDENRCFRSACRRLREKGLERLGRDPELWITEVGWNLKWISESEVAKWLPRIFIAAADAGVKATCWFSSRDVVDGPMGLVDNNGNKRKAYFAFKTMSEELREYELVSQVVGLDTPTTGPQVYLFRKGNEFKAVAWVVGSEQYAYINLPVTGGATAVDYLGSPVPVAGGQFTLISYPIYISGFVPIAPPTNLRIIQ